MWNGKEVEVTNIIYGLSEREPDYFYVRVSKYFSSIKIGSKVACKRVIQILSFQLLSLNLIERLNSLVKTSTNKISFTFSA